MDKKLIVLLTGVTLFGGCIDSKEECESYCSYKGKKFSSFDERKFICACAKEEKEEKEPQLAWLPGCVEDSDCTDLCNQGDFVSCSDTGVCICQRIDVKPVEVCDPDGSERGSLAVSTVNVSAGFDVYDAATDALWHEGYGSAYIHNSKRGCYNIVPQHVEGFVAPENKRVCIEDLREVKEVELVYLPENYPNLVRLSVYDWLINGTNRAFRFVYAPADGQLDCISEMKYRVLTNNCTATNYYLAIGARFEQTSVEVSIETEKLTDWDQIVTVNIAKGGLCIGYDEAVEINLNTVLSGVRYKQNSSILTEFVGLQWKNKKGETYKYATGYRNRVNDMIPSTRAL